MTAPRARPWSTDAEDVGGHAVELDAGVLQRLVEAVGLLLALLDLRFAEGHKAAHRPVSRGRLPRHTNHGLTGTRDNAASAGDAHIIPHFIL